MSDRIYNVLFLCTGNTARSILAEGILRKEGAGRFNAFSAGSHPKGVVNPYALKTLAAYGYPAEDFRSKSWEEYALPGAPKMDFVFTVCDSAAGEVCPIWPGQPMTAHWGIEDPAAAEGTDIEKQRAFNEAFRYLRNRIAAFTSLPLQSIGKLALSARLKEIGGMEGATPGLERRADGSLRSSPPPRSRGPWHRFSGRCRRGLGHHGRDLDARCCPATPVQHAAHWRGACGAHLHPWTDLRRALQSRGLARFRRERRAAARGGRPLHRRAGDGRHRRHDDGSPHVRPAGAGTFHEVAHRRRQWFAEAVATFGLVATILAGLRFQKPAIPWLVSLYITSAYWFTASTSFANPAVTIARALTNTFSGIAPASVPLFIASQVAGALLAALLASWLFSPMLAIKNVPSRQDAKL